MREEIVYQWRIKWLGKWGLTRYKCTEERIRKEHMEAIMVEGSREVRLLPETPEELAKAGLQGVGAHLMASMPDKFQK
jgi:hypothetical protein